MKKKQSLQTSTFKDMLKKQMKSKDFRIAYREEVVRLGFVQQIKEARIAKNLTQEELASKAEMPQSVIARIESGRVGLTFTTLSRIAFVLGKKIQLV